MSTPTLVTGAAGFIGSHLVERLASQGRRVLGIDNFSPFYSRRVKEANLASIRAKGIDFEFVESDIRDQATIAKLFSDFRPAVVVHLAAMAGVRPSIENPSLYADVNVTGTVKLLESAARAGVEKFLFASSSSVYGNNAKTPFSESDRVDSPISPYAATKRAGELLCGVHATLYGAPVTCLRFFTVYGPRQRPDLAISQFLNAVSRGTPLTLFGDGSSSRDYTYIDDVIDGVCAAIDHCKGFNIYNLGGSRTVRLSDLVAEVERCVGAQAVIERLPMQSGDVSRTFADLTKSATELGYAPKTPLQAGLRAQWRWMQDQTVREASRE